MKEAGKVRRLRAEQVAGVLETFEFSVRSERYVMYYRHEPGRAAQLLSGPLLYPAFKAGFGAADRLAGRWGNKLCVTGVRPGDGSRGEQ